MLRIATDLPDSLILLLPLGGGGVGAGDQETPGVLIDRADLVGQLPGRAEQLPVDINLSLAPGAVADPNRPAVLPARQVTEFALAEVVLAADAEHDLQTVCGPIEDAAAVVMNSKKSVPRPGQAATQSACMVKLASRTHE